MRIILIGIGMAILSGFCSLGVMSLIEHFWAVDPILKFSLASLLSIILVCVFTILILELR
jgi:hypothetical protein